MTARGRDQPLADVFVAFGITGDLAKLKTFTSLYRLEQRGLTSAGAAQAAQHTTVTQTEHIHGAFAEPNFDANPCTGAPITNFSAFGNVVEHETFFIEDGQMTEVWATFTETGKVSATDANGVSVTGHFTVWGNFNLNENNTNNTFSAAASSGSPPLWFGVCQLAGGDASEVGACSDEALPYTLAEPSVTRPPLLARV